MAADSAAGPAGLLHSRAIDHVAMAVGTTKGLFILSDGRVDGPFFAGDRVPAFTVMGDHYLAATVNSYFGPGVSLSGDAGINWTEREARPLAFPADAGSSLVQTWQLHVDKTSAGTVWAGVEPAALFRADDGQAFELVRSLWDHPHRQRWEPGGGGLGLHTILTHPERPGRVIVAVSAGGVYRSDDGGQTWWARNKGIAASFLPDPDPEFGQCVHKVAIDAGSPDHLWAQNHGGVYRSEDAGDTWVDVGRPGQPGGLPADFGFPIVAHPKWPDTAYVFPLDSDEFRCSAGGRCRVYRTTDAGQSWEPLTRGLPQSEAYVTVLRDAFTIGAEDPHVLAFGTRSGEVYASVDAGDSWRLAGRHLPPVLSVRVLS